MKAEIQNIDWTKPVRERSPSERRVAHDLSMKKFQEARILIIESLNNLDPEKMSDSKRRLVTNRMRAFLSLSYFEGSLDCSKCGQREDKQKKAPTSPSFGKDASW